MTQPTGQGTTDMDDNLASMHVSLISFNPALFAEDETSNQEAENNKQDEGNQADYSGLSSEEIQDRLQSLAPTDLQNGEPESSVAKKAKLEYKKYSDEQIMGFINLIIEGMSVKAAANKSGITPNSAYRYRKMWNEGGVTPVRNKRGPAEGTMSKLKDEHTKFIIKFVDNEPNTVALSQIKDALTREFPDLQVSTSALHRHMRAKCCLSLKRTQKPVETRNEVEYIAAAIESWMTQSKDIEFEKNCIFIGEATYSQHFSRNSGWASKGKAPEAAEKPRSSQGVSVTMLGAISTKGVIDVSLRKATLSGKKRRADGTEIDVSEDDHFLGYLMNVMNVLDSHGLAGFYLIMDDTILHNPLFVKKEIEQRGFKCAYSRNVFPFPNPIERFWAKTLEGIDRRPFEPEDQLSTRIMESCAKITEDDCKEWIRHAATYLPQKLAPAKTLYE